MQYPKMGLAEGLADSIQDKIMSFMKYERMEYGSLETERSLFRHVLLLILIVVYPVFSGAADLPESQTFFNENISVIIQGKCIACHIVGGQAQSTGLTYLTSTQTNAQQTNYETLSTFIEEDPAEGETVLENARGLNHGGGVQLSSSSAQYANMSTFIDLVNAEKNAPLDTDGDGISDAEDAFPDDPLETSDTDGDLVGDNSDNCVLTANTDQVNTDGDIDGDACDSDDDDDGVLDELDDLPLDPSEHLDTDGDLTGNNQDLDDDNDGISDQQELLDGTDPLSLISCLNCFSWDADADTKAEALSDGLLLIRYLFGFTGQSLVSGAVASAGQRTSGSDIETYFEGEADQLDIDNNGEALALSDGLLLIRYLFGFRDDALVTGAVAEDAVRTTQEIELYLESLMPAG